MKNYPLTHLPALALLSSVARIKKLEMSLKQRFPKILGLPVMGPYVQLYRQDSYFKTQISVFNYFSTFLPNIPTKLEYKVVAYRRDGSKIGSGIITLEHGQSVQVQLEAVIGKPLDEFGIFHVQAKPYSSSPEEVSKIGTTTGQFMTLFCPTDTTKQAPQFIHSHRPFQNFPIPYSPYTRKPNYAHNISGQSLTEFLFLNPCASSTQMVLHIFDAKTGKKITQIERNINGFGVEKIELKKEDLHGDYEWLSLKYEFSRRISHMKPIVFHHYPDGIITCNHT
jgi:hypothetical protein